MNHWIETHYPIGQPVQVPDLRTGELAQATVINHTMTNLGTEHRVHGILIRFEDGYIQEIRDEFLNESGMDQQAESIPELAKIFGMDESTLYKAIKSGRLEYRMSGKVRLSTRRAVKEMMARRWKRR